MKVGVDGESLTGSSDGGSLRFWRGGSAWALGRCNRGFQREIGRKPNGIRELGLLFLQAVEQVGLGEVSEFGRFDLRQHGI